MARRRFLAAAALIVVAACALRAAAAVRAGALWRDEANDVFLCRNATSVADLFDRLRAEGSPPLRFAIECGVQRAAHGSVPIARGLVIAFGSAAVLLVMATTRRPFGDGAALLAGAIAATSPFLIRYSVELRGYALLQFAAALYAWLLLRARERPTRAGHVAAGFAAGALALTHYYGALLVIGATGVLALLDRDVESRRLAVRSSSIAALLFLPWIPWLADQSATGLRPWATPNGKAWDAMRAAALPLGRWGLPLAIGAIASGAHRAIAPADEDDRGAWRLLVVSALAANAAGWLLQFVPSLTARLEAPYLAGMAVWLVGPMAAGLLDLIGGLGARRPALGGPRPRAALTASIVALGLVSQAGSVSEWLRPRSASRDVARLIARDGRPGDLIVILPAPHASAFNFYYDGALEQWAPPFRTRITNVPWQALVARMTDERTLEDLVRDLADRLRQGGRVWLVVGGSSTAAPGADADERTEYARAVGAARRAVVGVLERHATAIPLPPPSAIRYWEPMTVALYESARDARTASAR